jgi:hypothetical protein
MIAAALENPFLANNPRLASEADRARSAGRGGGG